MDNIRRYKPTMMKSRYKKNRISLAYFSSVDKSVVTFRRTFSRTLPFALVYKETMQMFPEVFFGGVTYGVITSEQLQMFFESVLPGVITSRTTFGTIKQGRPSRPVGSSVGHGIHTNRMRAVSPTVDHPTLNLLQKCKTLNTFKQAHAQMITTGLILHTYPISRILLLSSTLATLSYTLTIFNQVQHPSIFLYNTLIASLIQKDHTKVALSLYDQILTHPNLKPNNYTYPSLFKAFGAHQWFKHGQTLHAHPHMQKSLVEPSEVTLVALITACAELGALSQGIWGHVYIIRNELSFNHYIGTTLITLHANSGCLRFAWQVFHQLPHKDTFCFNAMIRGLAIHGHGHDALDLFEITKQEGFVPDDVTILAVMCACSHVGLVDEGHKHFESMSSIYGLEPKLEHYCCLVDLLGRAGLVKEAKEKVLTIPMKPNAILWRSLLGAARVHGNLEIGEVALRKLIELEPETSGNYVLLSNMYACMDRWDDAKRVRQLMKDHGIDKMPGSSLVEVDGSLHEFLIGDKSHPYVKDIYLKS
ncbi:hypothetical protein DH2020_004827 [Rehmannia glutinosa]|uniref:Pentatricopeptide repeat-containing protein n=1 Tax=Rehmannia glutinosa TaxID=99300 RepID=A0ABR0XQU0_REHGL